MIVQPDFLDHWKTSLLCDLLEDDCAPLYVLRLWAHCQNRRTHIIACGTPRTLKAICKAPQDPAALHSAMIEAGYIRMDGDSIVAHDWDEVNASLIANWKNGKLGGRPAKKPRKKPMGSERVNPSGTDKRRGDKNTPYSPQKGENIVKKDRNRFKKPTPQEVSDYAKSIEFDLNGEEFCDYYDSKGWKIGKTPMKNWEAAVRTWKRNRNTRTVSSTAQQPKRTPRDCNGNPIQEVIQS